MTACCYTDANGSSCKCRMRADAEADRDRIAREWADVSQANYQRAKAAEAEAERLRAEVERMEAAHAQMQSTMDRVTAERDAMRGMIRWAHDTLYELNPSNYDHDEVCLVNDAAVEVILGLAPVIGETHGKTSEWWSERAALSQATPEIRHDGQSATGRDDNGSI